MICKFPEVSRNIGSVVVNIGEVTGHFDYIKLSGLVQSFLNISRVFSR